MGASASTRMQLKLVTPSACELNCCHSLSCLCSFHRQWCPASVLHGTHRSYFTVRSWYLAGTSPLCLNCWLLRCLLMLYSGSSGDRICVIVGVGTLCSGCK